jgi:hypothetical protein
VPQGICKMCLRPKELIRSHLIPRAVYSLCRTADSEPVKFNKEVIMQTSRQTQDYLLCAVCDNFLSEHGENWVLPKLKTWDKGFPLYDLLAEVPPDVIEGDGAAYAAMRNPKIDTEAITHFAIGIFWKASVHPWLKDRKEPRIELGPYSDKLRQFLRNEAGFPKYVMLNVGIARPETMFSNAVEPYQGSSTGVRNYVFNVPGMQFVLTVGKTIDAEIAQTCFNGNPLHPIIVTDLASSMMEIYRMQAKKAHRSKKLVEYLAARKKAKQPPAQ